MSQPKIVYEASEEVLMSAIKKAAGEIIVNGAIARFDGQMVGFRTALEVLKLSEATLYKYINAGLIDCERDGKLYKFDLGYLLRVDLKTIRKTVPV